MRRKKNREARLLQCEEILVREPYPKGEWKKIFQNDNPIQLEIGCGKGGFITGTASEHPDINYIAIEKCADVLVLAVERVKAAGLKNVRFIGGDAALLEEITVPGECERFYVNFCDPWPKSKQAKRRLTHQRFLSIYRQLLSPVHGELHFKTDNRQLFEFSLNEFNDAGLGLRNITHDLHNSDFKGNIMTEYETLFSKQGMPIYRCEVLF